MFVLSAQLEILQGFCYELQIDPLLQTKQHSWLNVPCVRKGRRGQGNWEGDRARGRRDRKVGFLALVVRPKSLCPLSLPFQLHLTSFTDSCAEYNKSKQSFYWNFFDGHPSHCQKFLIAPLKNNHKKIMPFPLKKKKSFIDYEQLLFRGERDWEIGTTIFKSKFN